MLVIKLLLLGLNKKPSNGRKILNEFVSKNFNVDEN